MLGVVRGLEVISPAQVFDHLYRPDLVEEALKGDPEGKYKDEAFRLNLQKVLDSGSAPQIEHLKERDARAGDTHQVSVRVTDVGGSIGDRIVWRVGDQVRAVSSARIQPRAATDKAVTVMASIPVDPGQDTLGGATAYNAAGLLATRPTGSDSTNSVRPLRSVHASMRWRLVSASTACRNTSCNWRRMR